MARDGLVLDGTGTRGGVVTLSCPQMVSSTAHLAGLIIHRCELVLRHLFTDTIALTVSIASAVRQEDRLDSTAEVRIWAYRIPAHR